MANYKCSFKQVVATLAGIETTYLNAAQLDFMVFEEAWWSTTGIWTHDNSLSVQNFNLLTNNDMFELAGISVP